MDGCPTIVDVCPTIVDGCPTIVDGYPTMVDSAKHNSNIDLSRAVLQLAVINLFISPRMRETFLFALVLVSESSQTNARGLAGGLLWGRCPRL